MLDFPASPTDGQQFAAPNGVVYQFAAPPNIWTTAFVGSTKPPTTVAYPEEFGAVGDGVSDDGTAIHAWLQYCNANNLKAVGTPDAVYKLSDAFVEHIRVPFDGNGCEFTCSNNGQDHNAVFVVESMPEDIETLTMAALNTWTGLYRGSRQIPQLTERGWSYAFYTTDEYFLARSIGGGQNKGEGFEVVADNGLLSKELITGYTTPFSSVVGYRRRIRPRMVVQGLIVRLTTGAVLRDRIIDINRPHTTLRNCQVSNDTATDCAQGFVHSFATSIVYEGCSADNLSVAHVADTCYGFTGNYCDDVAFIDCSETECRRGIDSGGCSNYTIDGGSYPDGIGGHWLDGLHVYGRPFLSCNHPTNPQAIHISGGNVNIESADIHITPDKSRVLGMRADVPELRGLCRLGRGVDITINETGYVGAVRTLGIIDLSIDDYDTLRPVYLPSTIDCMPGLIRQIGASSTNFISLVTLYKKTAALFPRNINMPLQITVEPGALELAGGYLSGGSPRLTVYISKSQTSIGDYCKVRVAGIRLTNVQAGVANAATNTAVGRYDLDLNGISETGCTIEAAPGAARRTKLVGVHPATTVVTTGIVTALGDEYLEWDRMATYVPTYTKVANVTNNPAHGAAHYEVTSRNSVTRIRVFGGFNLQPTAAANTLTEVGISLPFPTTLANYSLFGTCTSPSANQPPNAGITADTVNNRAKLSFLSAFTAATTIYYSFEYTPS